MTWPFTGRSTHWTVWWDSPDYYWCVRASKQHIFLVKPQSPLPEVLRSKGHRPPMTRKIVTVVFAFALAWTVLVAAVLLDMTGAPLMCYSPTEHTAKAEGYSRLQYSKIQEWTFPSISSQENSTISRRLYRSRSQMHCKFNSTVQFILTIGLEGALPIRHREVVRSR